jgi:ribonuclease P protein component
MYTQEPFGQKNVIHDYSFPKQARILRRSEFLYIARRGKRYSTQYFIILIASNAKNQTRLGITVSKKIGNAVKRNYLKRRIREFFRLHKYQLPESTDILIVARKGINVKRVTYAVICNDLKSILVKERSTRTNRKGDP